MKFSKPKLSILNGSLKSKRRYSCTPKFVGLAMMLSASLFTLLQLTRSVSFFFDSSYLAGSILPSLQRIQPIDQLERFLVENPTTPATLFVELLRNHLHFEPGLETRRMMSCSLRSFPNCYGGVRNYRDAMRIMNADKGAVLDSNNKKGLEGFVKVPLYETDYPEMSVYELRRYHQSDKLIPCLATHAACIPLLLAGYAAARASPESVVVEFGPYAGMSSKCIVAGMLKGSDGVAREQSYYAFDSFQGELNYRHLVTEAPWLADEYPEWTEKNSNFLFLWKRAIEPIYPTAVAAAGKIEEETVHSGIWGHRDVALLSIDSAKTADQLLLQTEGLGTMKKGTILFLMDFDLIRGQIKLLYGCFRQKYLLPVYLSWSKEHWGFIVMEDFRFDDTEVFGTCVEYIVKNQRRVVPVLQEVIEKDLKYLGGLTGDATIQANFDKLRATLEIKMKEAFTVRPLEWRSIRDWYRAFARKRVRVQSKE